MAVGKSIFDGAVTSFEDWYDHKSEDPRDGSLQFKAVADCGAELWQRFEAYKREHLARVAMYKKYEKMADAQVVREKPDLPNVSSGEIAGMVRRTARVVVQHTPNVDVISEFDDDSAKGLLARHILRTKIIRDELNSNEMQQNLFSSVVTAFTLGFDTVVPVLMQQGDKSWIIDYDTIHYQDVFPEPGVKDVRKAPEVFVRRYLTRGEVRMLVRQQPPGWDIAALRRLLKTPPAARQRESVDRQSEKHKVVPEGYEVITWYSRTGDPFLTFDAREKMLLRIEENRDPLRRHPVFFLVLERDPLQPLGRSQISLVYGRQEFQDLMLNGAMKLWYRNINPSLIGYGTGLNGVPNLSPGKYTNIPNPNAKIEAFEVNTQTLLQYGQISQQNQGSMINLVGAADQQMAASAGNGMSATPQGVEAQQAMVDITTNNYQKAVEHFFSQYCSYALTIYFQELKGSGKLKPTADTRKALLDAGVDPAAFDDDGTLNVEMKDLATLYSVRCVPGSLVEMEDEKQLRILNQLFVPLSQAMPALAATQNPEILAKAAAAMEYIISKEIELSGSAHAGSIKKIFTEGPTARNQADLENAQRSEEMLGELTQRVEETNTVTSTAIVQMQEQLSQQHQVLTTLLEKLGVTSEASSANGATSRPISPAPVAG